MPMDLAQFLRQTIDHGISELRALSDEKAASSPRPGAWSPKQELGHLIDSAANNHLRFIVAAIEGAYEGSGYAQDRWVEAHGYQDLPWLEIVELWYRYNLLLAHVVANITEDQMGNRCVVASSGGASAVTLRFLIEDYVIHMQHHVDHVLSRPVVTPYPHV
jgi:hypothetical protein